MEYIKIVYRYPGRVVYGGTCLDVFPVHLLLRSDSTLHLILPANSTRAAYNNIIYIYKKHIFAQKQ